MNNAYQSRAWRNGVPSFQLIEANMTKQFNDRAYYADNFKAWPKGVGSQPTAEQLNAVHMLGLRPGKQALANAMALRAEGVTNAQIIQVCGNPQLNRMKGLITDKLFKRVPAPNTAEGHTVYKCEITAKGLQRIEGARKRADEAEAAGKAEGETKAKPAKAAKAATKAKGAAKRKGKADTAKPEQTAPEPANGVDVAAMGDATVAQAATVA